MSDFGEVRLDGVTNNRVGGMIGYDRRRKERVRVVDGILGVEPKLFDHYLNDPAFYHAVNKVAAMVDHILESDPEGYRCHTCGDTGYVIWTSQGHDPRCEGDCRLCPVPIPEQAPCPDCEDSLTSGRAYSKVRAMTKTITAAIPEKVTYSCDKCGGAVQADKVDAKIELMDRDYSGGVVYSHWLHLCYACTRQFERWLQEVAE